MTLGALGDSTEIGKEERSRQDQECLWSRLHCARDRMVQISPSADRDRVQGHTGGLRGDVGRSQLCTTEPLIKQDGKPRECRYRLPEKLDLFPRQVREIQEDAGHIPAGMGKAGGEAAQYRIALEINRNDRDRCPELLSSCQVMWSPQDQAVRLQANEVPQVGGCIA